MYLQGMLAVFGYTTAMATEDYPEFWVSNNCLQTIWFGIVDGDYGGLIYFEGWWGEDCI